MLLEAAISLICFIWGDILGNNIPLMHLEFNGLNGFYLTPFYTLGWANIPVFGRNAGMFNEPGSHQIFLNFALLFLLCDDDNFDMKASKYRISIILLIITIFTTLSTTGFICLGVVLLTVSLKKKENETITYHYPGERFDRADFTDNRVDPVIRLYGSLSLLCI